ncbi:MAG: beta-N-acetylhexosaminidase [Rhodobacteraceae bacterium]|nr:beta-N-acetylhexosaminidase [Paracoccaceae bacterium]
MAGAFILGCAGEVLSPREIAFFREADPWGFILFDRNVRDRAQLSALTRALRDTVGRDASILIDQEGGRVQRMWAPEWTDLLPALDQCDGADDPVRAMYLRSRLIAHELHEVGIDVNCAPLGDTAGQRTHPRLLNRCYGRTPAEVASRARAVVDGQRDGGVLSILKHIPGHGSSTKDTHVDLPVVPKTVGELHAHDFAPFKALNDVPMGMTAHIIFSAYDETAPATTSPIMHRAIREEIGFDGLLMTDDLSMEALSGDVQQRCTDALSAGCDLILHCNGEMAEMEVVASFGEMTDAAATRAARALAQRQTPVDIDISALHAELAAMMEDA